MALVLISFISCVGTAGNRVEVKIEIPEQHTLDFSKYNKIIYKDLTLESLPKDLNPGQDIKEFFLKDFAKSIDKNIESWTPEAYGDGKPVQNALLISGTLKTDLKERSKIEESKNKSGKKQRGFVTIQNWAVTLTVIFTDLSDGKEIHKETLEEKKSDTDQKNMKFNFNDMFYKLSNKLVFKLTQSKRPEKRFLLL